MLTNVAPDGGISSFIMVMHYLYNPNKNVYICKGEENRKVNVILNLIISRGRSFEVREVIIWILIMSTPQGRVTHLKRKVDKWQVGQRLPEIRVSWRNRRRAGSGQAWWLYACGCSACLGRAE